MNEKELVGITLGSCTLERVIGKGGMAIVFLAQQANPIRTVAVKVLLPAATGTDPEQQRVFLERFRREAATVQKLEHKNILPIYEYAEAMVKGQRVAYLVMPYIRGGTLRQRIDEVIHSGGQFDLPTVSTYISQVADALSYAHGLGIIHRDVKPGNLLFHTDGHLLLSDFGIARLNTMPALTMAGSFLGTAEYASPEQVSGGDLDARSDIYSLGVILYELLTGRVPFSGTTPFAVMGKQLQDPVPSVRVERPDLSPSIEFVVRKALAKEPKDRYQQATELAADLHAAIRPVVAPVGGLHLSGDGNNSEPTVADSSWQPPARAQGPANLMPRVAGGAGVLAATVPASPSQVSQPPLPQMPPPAGGAAAQHAPVQVHLPQIAPDIEDSEPAKLYRPGRRIYYYAVGLITLVLQFITLGLVLGYYQHYNDISAVVLGVLLGNALNWLSLAAIAFTSVTRRRDMRGIFKRMFWTTLIALIASGVMISAVSPQQTSGLPLATYLVLLATNLYSLRQLSKADAKREQIEVAPVAWRAALVGALTGLIPLIIILVFALVVPLPWVSNSSLFLRMLAVLAVGFIGAPTPGAMMAVWLSQKMSFPILTRTSAIAGLLMFLAAYLLVIVIGVLISGQMLLTPDFSQQILPLAVIIMGTLLGLIGLLRGMLDAWIYHRVMMRQA